MQIKGVNFQSVDKLSSGYLMSRTIIKGISWRNQFQFQKPVSVPVPDDQNKRILQQSYKNFWFPNTYRSYMYTIRVY